MLYNLILKNHTFRVVGTNILNSLERQEIVTFIFTNTEQELMVYFLWLYSKLNVYVKKVSAFSLSVCYEVRLTYSDALN